MRAPITVITLCSSVLLFFSFTNSYVHESNAATESFTKLDAVCGVEVLDVSKVATFGYLVEYTVQFKNNAESSIDGLYWTAHFYNNANEKIRSMESSFNSDALIDPIAPGESKFLIRSPRIKGASKVEIVIDKVHFVSGKLCN